MEVRPKSLVSQPMAVQHFQNYPLENRGRLKMTSGRSAKRIAILRGKMEATAKCLEDLTSSDDLITQADYQKTSKLVSSYVTM